MSKGKKCDPWVSGAMMYAEIGHNEKRSRANWTRVYGERCTSTAL